MTDDELFLTAILNCTRSELYTRPAVLTAGQRERLEAMRWRRAAGEPVQYICGFTEFLGHRIDVGPGVLIPRPETEILAEALIRVLTSCGPLQPRVLDAGTGSGALLVAVLKALPGARAVALDISPEALHFARGNVFRNSLESRVDFIERDMFWYVDEASGKFDAVVSNPPYIATGILDLLPLDVKREPEVALDGGPDGLHFYRLLVPAARRLLVSGGWLALEFGDGQRKELENLFHITGPWDKMEIIRDNAGKNRVILARTPLY